jgi:hypothetical protein
MGDEGRPAGLVGGAEPFAGIAVEALAERRVDVPQGIVGVVVGLAGPATARTGPEESDEPLGQVVRGLRQVPLPA